jgi:hypothetical protein
VHLTAPEGDPRIFVVEQSGYIELFDQSGNPIGQFLNIDARVLSGGERGLLSVAFPSDYATSGRFYVNYTNNSGDTVISRFTVGADPNDADESTEEILITIDQPFSNHNGGKLLFGPEFTLPGDIVHPGYLYIGTGDGGSGGDPGNRAQNLGLLLGKILRIDVNVPFGYTIPPTNPWAAAGDGGADEIWSYGVRNPWGMDFDPTDGDLYWADVGQNAWEELNVQPKASEGGENWGWKQVEGFHCYVSGCNLSLYDPPVHEYSHAGGRCSVTGGIVYRGSISSIQGDYFFAEYCSDQIWSFEWDGAGGITGLVDRTADLTPPSVQGAIRSIVGIHRDGLGEMYILDHGGEVFKVLDDAVETPPAPPTDLQLKVLPNPFKRTVSIELGVDDVSEAEVAVFDLKGQAIRSWPRGSATRTVSWDGNDSSGRAVSPGIYYVQVTIGERVSRSRITLVR